MVVFAVGVREERADAGPGVAVAVEGAGLGTIF